MPQDLMQFALAEGVCMSFHVGDLSLRSGNPQGRGFQTERTDGSNSASAQ